MDRKIIELRGSLQDSTDEEPPFKVYTKVLKDTSKKNGPINKKLSELINTLWQQKEPLDKLKDEMGTYDPRKTCQTLAIKYCNEEIWNRHLQANTEMWILKHKRCKKLLIKVT